MGFFRIDFFVIVCHFFIFFYVVCVVVVLCGDLCFNPYRVFSLVATDIRRADS